MFVCKQGCPNSSELALIPSLWQAHLYSIRWVSYHSSASLLQSLICIWYVEICLCLHPSSKSSLDVNQSLAIIYLMDFCCLSLTLHCKDRLYCIWQLVLPIACIWYSNISRHRFKASLVFLPHWHHPSAHSLSRFLFLFLFHLWPLNLLRFRAFFHQQPTSPTTHCLYLIQQRPKSLLVFDTATAQVIACIWYSNLPSSHLASLRNILCLRLCQFVFHYNEFLTTRLHLFYNPSSVFDTLDRKSVV